MQENYGTAQISRVFVSRPLLPLRVAVTGSRISPPLFASIRLLGLETALERIDAAMDKLR